MSAAVPLPTVDSVDVRILIDNSLDILVPSTDLARRTPLAFEWSQGEQLRAEHGYALFVTVRDGSWQQSLLYDAGLGADTVLHNMSLLGTDPKDARAVVLSHGHADHHGGLKGMAKRLGRAGMPFVVHADAWLERRVVFPNGVEIHMPPPSREALKGEGWEIADSRGPTLLLDGRVMVTGQVERLTDFEMGFPLQQAQTPSGWEPDPWIWDDQAVVVNVRGRGLVVLSSCSHAGAINVMNHARRLTGVEHVHAFAGGMHLTGGLFESIIPRTVAELKQLAPDVVVPGHCTGWKAAHRIAAELPEAFLFSNVGTTLHFAA